MTIASAGRRIFPTSRCRRTKIHRSIVTRSCQSPRLAEPDRPKSRRDHGSGALVGEHFGQESIAQAAIDDVRALNASSQKLDDTLQLWHHAATGRALLDEGFRLVSVQPRELSLRLAWP